jgi:hypothetical protein
MGKYVENAAAAAAMEIAATKAKIRELDARCSFVGRLFL